MEQDDKLDAEIKKAIEQMKKKAKEKQGPSRGKGRPKKDEKTYIRSGD